MKASKLISWLIMGLAVPIVPLLVRTVMYAPQGIDSPKEEKRLVGWWGPATANVNWCEGDYVVFPQIAEFWNSLTSLTMVAHGLYGLWMHWGRMETRFVCAFITLSVVGFGSVLFHATLWRSMQLMDELPMLWCNGVFIYATLCMEDPRGRARTTTVLGVTVLTVLETVLVSLFDKDNQNIFLVSYLGGVVFLVITTRRSNRIYNPASIGLLMELAILFYALGGVVWLLDRNFCVHVRFLNLHAAWHLLASSGTFCSICCWLYIRHCALGNKPIVRRFPPVQYIDIAVDKQG